MDSVVDRVDFLEDLAEDVVHSRYTLGANVTNNQINVNSIGTGSIINDIRVLSTRPD